MSASHTSLNARAFTPFGTRPAVWASALGLAAILRRSRAGRGFHESLDLDERMLRDIGLTRHDVAELNSRGGRR